MRAHAKEHRGGQKTTFKALVLSSHHLDPRDWIQVVRLSEERL